MIIRAIINLQNTNIIIINLHNKTINDLLYHHNMNIDDIINRYNMTINYVIDDIY